MAARRALAVGDVKRATAAVDAARKLSVAYAAGDDSPEHVAAAISKYRQVTEGADNRSDEATRRQVADLLMEQAQQLLRWKDFDEAERLARHVQNLRVPYGPFESKPEALLERITAQRAKLGIVAGPGQPAPASAVRIVSGPRGGETKHPDVQAGYDGRDQGRVRQALAQEEAGARSTRAPRKFCLLPATRTDRALRSCPLQ